MTPISPAQKFYGLHFSDGVAEYRQLGKEPEVVYISPETALQMDPSYTGLPIHIDHADEEDANVIRQIEGGKVVRSFFNPSDGFHWCEFLVTCEEGLREIQMGGKLSNSYEVEERGPSGMWHGVQYHYEIKRAKPDHIAIVQNPRYAESIILSPDAFKEYNARKEAELKKLQNSNTVKPKESGMLKIFKREKVENSLDMESLVVELPTSKKEYTLAKLVNAMDKIENMSGYASDDHMVKLDNEEMSVAEMKEKYNSMCKKNAEDEEMKKKNEMAGVKEEKKENEEDEEKKKENEKEEEKKKENEEDKEKKNNSFEKLKNAHITQSAPAIDLSHDKVARGKSRYGSN